MNIYIFIVLLIDWKVLYCWGKLSVNQLKQFRPLKQRTDLIVQHKKVYELCPFKTIQTEQISSVQNNYFWYKCDVTLLPVFASTQTDVFHLIVIKCPLLARCKKLMYFGYKFRLCCILKKYELVSWIKHSQLDSSIEASMPIEYNTPVFCLFQ